MRRERFPIMLNPTERLALRALAHHEGLSAAAVLRRLLHKEATRLGLWQTARPQRPLTLKKSALTYTDEEHADERA